MKKSLRIFALMMAALTALSVMSVTMADTPKYYIGFAEADGNSPLYAGPGTNYSSPLKTTVLSCLAAPRCTFLISLTTFSGAE